MNSFLATQQTIMKDIERYCIIKDKISAKSLVYFKLNITNLEKRTYKCPLWYTENKEIN